MTLGLGDVDSEPNFFKQTQNQFQIHYVLSVFWLEAKALENFFYSVEDFDSLKRRKLGLFF